MNNLTELGLNLGVLAVLIFAFIKVKEQKKITKKVNDTFIKDIELLLDKLMTDKERNKEFQDLMLKNIEENNRLMKELSEKLK
ncbi:hypothetical protein WG909_06640 [Peptostreptococcaceae bacterium AGR-M142]